MRTLLSERLNARRDEIERTVTDRVLAVSDTRTMANPEYSIGLRTAVSAAINFGFTAIECGEERAPPIPVPLLAQARLAARNGVGLETVLRRYLAGFGLLTDFLIEEVEASGLQKGPALKRIMRAQTALFDQLLIIVSEEHSREAQSRPESIEAKRAERVRRLLDGEPLDTSGFSYDFEAHHLGLVARGLHAAEAIRTLAKALDRRLLLVRPSEETAWAWFGGVRTMDLDEFRSQLSSSWPSDISAALGEPGQGLSDWRLTHQQAQAAFVVALSRPGSIAHYSDVALIASMSQDELLVESLRRLYLAPLEKERDGGLMLRETLRAYFKTGRNISSAAAALRVSRQTVSSRLRLVEQHIDRSLQDCAPDLEAALRLTESIERSDSFA